MTCDKPLDVFDKDVPATESIRAKLPVRRRLSIQDNFFTLDVASQKLTIAKQQVVTFMPIQIDENAIDPVLTTDS